jgi:hypothetical protein
VAELVAPDGVAVQRAREQHRGTVATSKGKNGAAVATRSSEAA